jgi:hypothetical protein
VLIVLGLLGGGAAWALGTDAEEAAVVDAGVVAPDAPPAEPDAGPAEEVAENLPTEVRVRVLVAPGDAQIWLDGVEFPSPLDARRPRSLDPVRLRIERDGYQTIDELIVLDRDLELVRALEAGRSSSMRRPPETGMTETMETAVETPMMTMTAMEETTTMDGFRDDF